MLARNSIKTLQNGNGTEENKPFRSILFLSVFIQSLNGISCFRLRPRLCLRR